MTAEATLLWALRSPCDAGCRYCYFGQIDEHRQAPPSQIGQLSHLGHDDLDPATVLDFAATIPQSPIGRVVIAGGEPLNWVPTMRLIEILRAGGVSVTIATNGVPLNRVPLTHRLIDLGVDAVSVSLDHVDAAYNDRMRPFRSPSKGWKQVVSGIATLIQARGDRQVPHVGVYMVVTTQNLEAIADLAEFASGLGVDYLVPQPLSLADDHPLAGLRLTARHAPLLAQQLRAARQFRVRLPADPYPDQFAAVISTATLPVEDCFGGRRLLFAQPNGTVWDCPSSLKIAATPPQQRRSLVGIPAADLFTPKECGDCSLMSDDCVAMFPLVNDLSLYRGARR